MIEQFLAHGGIHSRHGVYSDADIELLDGFPERIKLGMIEGARADGSRDHDADRALGFNRVFQFFRRRFGILQSDDRGEAQSSAALGAAFSDPSVVRARNRS